MTHTEGAAEAVVVVHATALLAAPALGADAVGLVEAEERLACLGRANGFFQVARGGRAGYVPAALCEPLAVRARGAHPSTRLVQPVALYTNPAPGYQSSQRWIVAPDEPVALIAPAGRFVLVQRASGQRGYVPAVLCRPADPSGVLRLRQAVSLYASPEPGAQFAHVLDPQETLLLLGRDERFVLVQREGGQLGYVPAVLCGDAAPDTLIKVGPLDLGWVFLGGGWSLLNGGALLALIQQAALLEPLWKPYLVLALLLGLAATFWLLAPRRTAARSFALGMLLCYGLMHLSSGGSLTLWR